jgi:hypothetical protein
MTNSYITPISDGMAYNGYHERHISEDRRVAWQGEGHAAHLEKRRRTTTDSRSFDIDNMVIPCNVVSTARVETLEYKEIVTPK